MLFDQTNNIGAMIANKVLYLTNSDGRAARNCKILVYSGTQPSIADFLANWDTMYYLVLEDDWNSGAPASYGTNLLAGYGAWTTYNAQVHSSNQAVKLTSSTDKITLDTSGGVAPKYYYQTGTATWAVIFLVESLGSTSSPFVQANTDSFRDTPFIIAPVSDITGNGTVRLSSTAITSTVPDLGDVYLSFNVG